MRLVHPVTILFTCCFLCLCHLNGQTTLNYGDIAIVGVASNVGDDDISAYCETGTATGRDRISIVCFKDLSAGTTIDLTDNGWERLTAGKWGNSEGFLSITRTGGTIPAGTTITFELPRTSSGQSPVCLVPDDNWSYASLGTRYVNFGSNGDQLYLMQDGVWNNGTGCPTACAHDATYTGGRVLYGFSSSGWVNTPPGSANGVNFSRLHPSVANCFNVSVPSNFASYQAPTSATTQAGWLTRIKTPADWVAYANCNAYQEPPPNFPISQADVSLSCSANCSGCAPLTTTLKLSIGLPSSWGPFTVVVSNGTNNITLSNAVNNQTFNVVSNASTNYSIISFSAANGCPLTYTFNTVPITVFTRPLYQNYTAQVCQGTSLDLSTLTYQGTNITGNTLTFHSNTPPNAGNQLPSQNVTINGPITYYGLATNADGCRDTFPIQFTTVPAPNAGTAAAPFTQCFMSTGAGMLTLANSLTGEMLGGVWSLGAGSDNPGSNFNAVVGTLNLNNLAAGNYLFDYTVMAGACGSDVETVAVQIFPAVQISASTTNADCNNTGGTLTVTVNSGTSPYQFNIGQGNQNQPTFTDLAAGNYAVTVTDNTGCTAIKTVTLSQAPRLTLSAAIQQLNCAGGGNGSISLSVSGGTPGYSYDWNINAFDGLSSISNLGAGIYTVIVSDQHNCLIDTSFEIINGAPLDLSCAELNPVSALGGSDGVGRVTASGNVVFPLNVHWAGPVSGTQNFNTAVVDITGLQAGAYNVTVTNALGCTANCSFVISNPNCVTDSVQIVGVTCDASLAGVQIQHLVNQFGCDSVVITTTTLLPGDTTSLNAVTCDVTQVGVNQQVLTGVNGCDSLVITTTILLPADTIFLTATTCNAAQTGVNQQVLTGINGCDSLVITNTILLPADTTFLTATTCNAAQVGVNQQVLTGINGCDSLVITTTTLLPADTTFLTVTTCNAAQTGVNQQVLTGINGCDSLVITTTTLLPADTTYLTATTCNATQVGVNQQVLTGVNGCDSLVVTTTTLLPTDTTFLTVTTCNAAQTGVNQQVLTSINGCDSLLITTTTLLPVDTTFLTATTCNAAQVGVNQQVLTGINGCDSLLITTTTLLPSDTTYLNGFTCDPIFVGETIQYVTNGAGCVTVVISTLSLIPTDTTYAYKTTCDPIQAGTTVQLIPVANGCDSVVITTTTLVVSDTMQFVSHTCDPAQAGITMQYFFNQYGCDSVLITNTILQFPDTTRLYFNTCNAAQTDTVLQQLTSINGCDSIVITATTYTPPAQGQYTAHLCSDQFVVINGVRYDAQKPSGTAVFPGAAASGCDSLLEVQLFFDALQVDFQANGPLCFGDKNGLISIESVMGGTAPYQISTDGTTFSNLPSMYKRQNLDAGNYPYTLLDSLGCRFDTTILLSAPVQINLDLSPEFTIHLGDSIQLDASTNIVVDSLVWQNSQSLRCTDCLQPYAQPFENTVYTLTVFDAAGCSQTGAVKVKVERVKGVYIPNVIMPDAAVPNNQLVVYADQSVSKVRQFHIYDRWGNELFALNNFAPNNQALGWNGTSKGEDLNPGVYVYFLEVEYVDGQTAIIEGDVTLIR